MIVTATIINFAKYKYRGGCILSEFGDVCTRTDCCYVSPERVERAGRDADGGGGECCGDQGRLRGEYTMHW